MRKLMMTGLACLVSSAAALAAAPGPIDGLNIPSNFGVAAELAAQTNNTGFGDQVNVFGVYTPGSEADGLYLAKDDDYLYVGIAGNVQQVGHSFVIFIDADDAFGLIGQQELRTEGANRTDDGNGNFGFDPPPTVPAAGREYAINTNGTKDKGDDFVEYLDGGTILPCAADLAVSVDTYGGTMYINAYQLPEVAAGHISFLDVNTNGSYDAGIDLPVYASKTAVGSSPVNDGDDIISPNQPSAYGPAGFNNTNTTGVTEVDASNANAATTGLEIGIPLSDLNDADELSIYVVILDGLTTPLGSFEPNAFTGSVVAQQSLPPITDADICTQGESLQRPDLTSIASCRAVTVSSLPNFTGVADGIIKASEYGGAADEVQTCPTPYGDQDFDDSVPVQTSGSELDVLYVLNDEDNLYLGITGNLEKNGNQFVIWIDSDPDGADLGTNGRENNGSGGFVGITTPGAGGGAFGNYSGDAMPEDISSNAVNWDVAFQTNIFGGGPNVYLDRYDWVAHSQTYLGNSQVDSGNGTLVGGSNPHGVMMAYNSSNSLGVEGNCFDGESCLFMTTNGFGEASVVANKARSATSGYEFVLPWASINVNPSNLPDHIHIWVHLTGGGGYGSNQALPSLRPRSFNAVDNNNNPIRHMVGFTMDGPNDYSDGVGGAPDRQFDSYAARYDVQLPPPCNDGDADQDGDVDLVDFSVFELCFSVFEPGPCECLDMDNDGDVDLADLTLFTAALTGP